MLYDSRISHLLYAGDLLVLSTSAAELQQNRITKNGQVKKDCIMFTIGQTHLECVNQYKYLGINVSSGKFIVEDKTYY